jgi:carboxynorspermidine decarboxylase
MEIRALKDKIKTSPAFIVDEAEVLKALKALINLRESSGFKVLYSIKALPLSALLGLAKPYVDGFSVSSLFEARLADEALAGQGSIHLTTPGISQDEIEELSLLCSHISCNSLSQFRQVASVPQVSASLGLRVNPKLSFTEDARHDPCRQFSKLGVAISDVVNAVIDHKVKGLHFHTVFCATDYKPLIQTLDKLQAVMGKNLSKLDWINLGGGYLFDQIDDSQELVAWIVRLKDEFGLDVYIEPGNAVVGKAGYLLATVTDCFNSDGKAIAILDTSVNHQPQVFEYQRQPELCEHEPTGRYPVILAGNTC